MPTPVPYTQIIHPNSGTRCGFIEWRPAEWIADKKYPLIIMLHGQGECGDGTNTSTGLLKLSGHSSMAGIEAAGAYHQFILMEPQTPVGGGWQYHEIDECYTWAVNNYGSRLDKNKMYICGLSLGGGGVTRYLAENARADLKFAGAVALCPGPNSFFLSNYTNPSATAYQNIAGTNMAFWFLHSLGDTTVTVGASTGMTYTNVKVIRSAVKMYKSTPYSLTHNQTWTNILGRYQTGVRATTPVETSAANNSINDPSMNIYEFLLANTLTTHVGVQRISTPTTTTIPVTTQTTQPGDTTTTSTTVTTITTTVPVTTTHPSGTTSPAVEKTIRGILCYADVTLPNRVKFEVNWTDGTVTTVTSGATRLGDGWIALRNGKLNIDMAFYDASNIRTVKSLGYGDTTL